MGGGGERLQAVLEGYDRFLVEKDLSSQKERPYLVRRVREFLLFARAHGAFTFEQTLDLFLARGNGLARSPGNSNKRRMRFASTATSTGAGDEGADGPARDAYLSDAAMLDRFRDIIRLRHYARSTEKTYLHWTRRFLAYRRQVGAANIPGPDANGAGNTSSPPTRSRSIRRTARCAVIICTRRRSRPPFAAQCARPESSSTPRHTPFATALPPTCCSAGRTSAKSRNCWATRASRRR